MLMDQAMEDEYLHERLLMKAAKDGSKGINLTTFRKAVGRGRFVDYYHAREYAMGIENVIDQIEDLLKEGFAAEVIELAEYALAKAEKSTHHVDDSDGWMAISFVGFRRFTLRHVIKQSLIRQPWRNVFFNGKFPPNGMRFTARHQLMPTFWEKRVLQSIGKWRRWNGRKCLNLNRVGMILKSGVNISELPISWKHLLSNPAMWKR